MTVIPPILQSVHATGTVHGLLLEMCVAQTYVNPGSTNIEAVYTFPLPHDAVLLGLECILGERTLTGRVVARADAEEAYEATLDDGDTAVMLERAADGVYTANLGNLLAHETGVVRIRYAQVLSFRQGQVRIALPNVIAPRFGDPASAGLRLHQAPEHDLRATYPFTLSLRLHGPVAAGRISSPSHALAVQNGGGCVDVSLAHADAAMLDRDVVLLSDGLAGTSIATIGRDADGYVALASFCPAPEEAPPALPLHLKILVDCSGSMNGDSIHGARKALHAILAQLQPSDRFSYSRFGSVVAHHSAAFLPATPRAVREASGWIAATAADMGGTELREALLSTFALGQPAPADILLITDGDVWDTGPLVASAAQSGQRIFAVGVGAAPAASLLQRLARGTGGACELVGANDDVHAAVLRMFRRMRQAPVHDVACAWDSEPDWQSAPGKVVFAGETVHMFAGFGGLPPAGAVMHWNDNSPRTHAMLLAGEPVAGDTLARVAAAHRLPDLPAGQRHGLAMQYALVTGTTSLLIVHERAGDERPGGMPVLRAVPQMQVAGRSGMGRVPRLAHPVVWRRESTSVQVEAMMRNGVEDYAIPHFLRKERDIVPFLYREQLRVFLQQHAAPATFAAVADALPGHVFRELCDIAESGYAPQDVLRSFIAVLRACFHRDSFATRMRKRLASLGASPAHMTPLERRVTAVAQRAFHARHALNAICDVPAFLRKQAD